MKFLVSALPIFLLIGCTTGRLEYVTPEGETKYGCETEYTWQPSVDKYAVKSMYKKGQLTDKQYGYLIAYMDLGHDKG
tara:strand:- start:20397 stop:20630 length:234 start_codon:yes stop_codon:yes gene_type:complete